METVGLYKAKTHLPKLIERTNKGELITITKYGTPIAILQPLDLKKNTNIQTIIMELRQFREKNNLAGLSIREMIEEGRR